MWLCTVTLKSYLETDKSMKQHLLPADKGGPVAAPFADAEDPTKEARKISKALACGVIL